MRFPLSRGAALGVLAAGSLAFPAVAAADVDVWLEEDLFDTVVHIDGTDDAETIVVTHDGDATIVTPGSGTTLVAGDNCEQDGTGVVCDDVAGDGEDEYNTISAVLAGGDDSYTSTGETSDRVDGGEGADTIVTGPQFDQVIGGPGADNVSLGAGVDRFEADPTADGADTVDGGSGGEAESFMEIGDAVSYGDRSSGVTIKLAGGGGEDTLTGIESAFGSEGADTITGSATSRILAGFGGADTITGGSANEVIEGGDGPDSLSGGPGADEISSRDGEADTSLSCGDGDDLLTADNALDPIDPRPAGCETIAPQIMGPATLSGDARVGSRLTVGVTTSGDAPDSVDAWIVSCAGPNDDPYEDSCREVLAHGTTYDIGAGEIGRYLRGYVSVSRGASGDWADLPTVGPIGAALPPATGPGASTPPPIAPVLPPAAPVLTPAQRAAQAATRALGKGAKPATGLNLGGTLGFVPGAPAAVPASGTINAAALVCSAACDITASPSLVLSGKARAARTLKLKAVKVKGKAGAATVLRVKLTKSQRTAVKRAGKASLKLGLAVKSGGKTARDSLSVRLRTGRR